MDQKAIETDIKNYKIRQGPLYKRSKFLKEWRERWIILTTNYLYTFTNKECQEMTDVIDLKQIKSYKSYLRKDEEMIPPGFKVRSADDMYYFCAKNCNEKWSWLVSLERLMDYKYVGTSNYNNADWIKTKGFDSQIQFQSGSSKAKTQVKVQHKQQGQALQKKESTDEHDKLQKHLDQLQKELDKKRTQIQLKQSSLITEQKRISQEWAKIEEARKKVQVVQVKVEQKPKQQPKHQEKKPEPVVEKHNESPQKKEEPKQPQSPTKTGEPQRMSMSQLRSMFQKKPEDQKTTPPPPKIAAKETKVEKKEEDISIYRSKIVSSMFEEYRKNVGFTNALKYVTDFLINVGGDDNSGYSSLILIEGKSNHNNKNFAQVFVQFLTNYQDYDKGANLMKFFEIVFFQMPHIFDNDQKAKSHKKILSFMKNVKNEQVLSLVLKNMLMMNKVYKYQKAEVSERLQKIVKQCKNQQARNWARKIQDDL